MRKPELLAPAGSMESLKAAISAGCDAVYLSGKKYGARSFAHNFNDEEIKNAINLCHLYGVKVYITVNTLIFENEVKEFLEYIDFLHKNNVDAILLQDIGMMDVIRKTYPNLEIHASTQMNIHSLEGVLFLENLGVKRIVLARELTIEEIKSIKENTKSEIEVFSHGALCVSYSGECLMSYLIGGRSGNKGECAGSCRLPYSLISNNKKINKNEYPLSMKDLNTLNYIDKLIECGIDSLKIEGRMKRPEYVYLVVSLYRKAIDSYIEKGKIDITDNDIKEMKKIFNREFTKGFLFDEENNNIVNENRPNHQGIKIGTIINYKDGYATIKLIDNININDGIRIIGKQDIGFIVTSIFRDKKRVNSAYNNDVISIKVKDKIDNGSIVVKTTDYTQLEEIKKAININRKVLINCKVKAKVNSEIEIEYSDLKNTVKVKGEKVSSSINCPISKEKIIKQISKLGDTIYSIDKIDIECDENIFVSIKELNELRRKLVEKLNEIRIYKTNYIKKEYKINLPNLKQNNEFNLEVFDLKIYEKLKKYNFNKIYVDFKELPKDNRVILKLPRIINSYKNFDSPLLVGNIGSLYKYKDIETDFSLNVTNSYSVAFLHSIGVKKVTLSYEASNLMVKDMYENYINRYSMEPNIEVIVASRKEAMVSKFNLNKKYNITNSYLLDRFNKTYPILERFNLMYIYNNKYEFNLCDLKINKRIIVNFEQDITNELINFIGEEIK